MRLLGAVVLLALGVVPGLVFDPLDAGHAGNTLVGLAVLGAAVLILVASLRGDTTRWYRVTSSVVATAAAWLWLIWSAGSALPWMAGL